MTLELRTCPVCKQEKVKLIDFSPKQRHCKECNRKSCSEYRKKLCKTVASDWSHFKFGKKE